MSLRGHAQLVLRDLPSDKGQYDSTIVRSLEERFFSPNQTHIYRVQLKKHRERQSHYRGYDRPLEHNNFGLRISSLEVRETLA